MNVTSYGEMTGLDVSGKVRFLHETSFTISEATVVKFLSRMAQLMSLVIDELNELSIAKLASVSRIVVVNSCMRFEILRSMKFLSTIRHRANEGFFTGMSVNVIPQLVQFCETSGAKLALILFV